MGKPLILCREREAEFRAQFPHHSDAELALRFGLTVRQAQYLGFKAGLHKTAATRSASRRERPARGEALTVRAQRLVAEMGRLGATREHIERGMPEVSPGAISSAINKITADRRVHRAGGKGKSRWFIDAADATAYAERQRAAKYAPAPVAPAAALTPAVKVATSRGPAYLPGDPVVPPGVKPQEGHPVPGPEGRWHSNARPVLRNLGPGVYTDEPSRWVAAITRNPKAA